MRYATGLVFVALALSGCMTATEPGAARSSAVDALSCSEILDKEHIRNAAHHRSPGYIGLVERYRAKKCPAPEFHRVRLAAIDEANIGSLSETDRAMECYSILVEKTRLDELVEWHSTAASQLSGLNFGSDGNPVQGADRKRFRAMVERKKGLGSLYEVKNCSRQLSPAEQMRAKEEYRAPLREARRRFVESRDKSGKLRSFGSASAEERSLSCAELVREIRTEEDSRVYRIGTASRTIVQAGSNAAGTLIGAMLFGEKGAAVGLILDAQSFEMIRRMTRREGRLLDLLNRRSCPALQARPRG